MTFPALLAKIFIPNRQKAVNKTVRKAVCQTCGYMWSFTNSDMKREIGNRNSMAQITVEDSIDPVDNNENALYSAEKTSQTNSLPEKETLQNESYFSEITKPITSFNLNSITDYFRDNKTFPQWPVNQNSIFDKFAAWIDNFVFNSDYRITTDKVLIVALISNVLGFHRVYSGRKISTILGWILLLFSFFSRDIALFLLLPWLIVDFIRISLGNYGRLKTNQKADFSKVKEHFLNRKLLKNTVIIFAISMLILLCVLLFAPKSDTSKSDVTVSQTDIVVSVSDENSDVISDNNEAVEPSADISVTSSSVNQQYIITGEEVGEYGRTVVLNPNTDMPVTKYLYKLPAGTYVVTTTWKKMASFFIVKDDIGIDDSNTEYPEMLIYVGDAYLLTDGENDYNGHAQKTVTIVLNEDESIQLVGAETFYFDKIA